MSFTMLLPTTNVFWCFGSDTIFTITRLYRYCFCCQIDFSFCGKLFMKWIVWWFCLLYTNMLWWCCNISFFNNFSFLYLTYHLILKWSESFFVSYDTICQDWCFPVFWVFASYTCITLSLFDVPARYLNCINFQSQQNLTADVLEVNILCPSRTFKLEPLPNQEYRALKTSVEIGLRLAHSKMNLRFHDGNKNERGFSLM